MTQPKADPQVILQLRKEGLRPTVIATRMGVSERTVHRWLSRLGGDNWKSPRASLTDSDREEIIRLRSDQVPRIWVAETVGCSADAVDSVKLPAGVQLDPDWKRIRLQIQHTPDLWRLHVQFAPRGRKRT